MDIITIDGISGVGKGMSAIKLADIFDYEYIGVGMIYRAFAYILQKDGINVNSKNTVLEVLSKHKFRLCNKKEAGVVKFRIKVDSVDVTDYLWGNKKIENITSHIAKIPEIRNEIKELVVNYSNNKNVIVEGRNIGTEVLPNATLKVYLTSDFEVRSFRMFRTLRSIHKCSDYKTIKEHLNRKDFHDVMRNNSPLLIANDMVLVDTSRKSKEEVVGLISKHFLYKKKSEKMSVSIIVYTMNNKENLYNTLNAIIKQDWKGDIEILVIDNGSVDGTKDMIERLQSEYIKYNYFDQSLSMGIAACKNYAIRNVKNNLVIFVDSDIVVKEDFIKEHVRYHEINDDLCVVGGYIYSNSYDNELNIKDKWRDIFFKHKSYNLGGNTIAWTLAYSCNISILRDNLISFNEGLTDCELIDVDFAYRLKKNHVKFAYNNKLSGYRQNRYLELSCNKLDKRIEEMHYLFNTYTEIEFKRFRMFIKAIVFNDADLMNEFIDCIIKINNKSLVKDTIVLRPNSGDIGIISLLQWIKESHQVVVIDQGQIENFDVYIQIFNYNNEIMYFPNEGLVNVAYKSISSKLKEMSYNELHELILEEY